MSVISVSVSPAYAKATARQGLVISVFLYFYNYKIIPDSEVLLPRRSIAERRRGGGNKKKKHILFSPPPRAEKIKELDFDK